MAHVDDEIASQPACWQRASELARTAAMALPRRGHTVAVVGCGTSWFIAQAYAVLRERAGHGETDAHAASQFPTTRRYDRIVAITRSGTTTEVLDLIRRLPDHIPITALTADPASPVNTLASDPITMRFADERSVVQTRFATTALALLRAHLDLPVPVDQATAALDAPLPLDPAKIEQVTFLGDGW